MDGKGSIVGNKQQWRFLCRAALPKRRGDACSQVESLGSEVPPHVSDEKPCEGPDFEFYQTLQGKIKVSLRFRRFLFFILFNAASKACRDLNCFFFCKSI